MSKFVIFFLLLAQLTIVSGQTPNQLFYKGDSLLWEEKNYSEAIDILKKVSQNANSDSKLLAKTHIDLGIAYYRLRDYENANRHYKQALNTVGSNEIFNKAIIYNQLGALYKDLQEFDAAINYFKIAYKNHPFSQTLGNIANTFLEIGSSDSALYYHKLSIQDESAMNVFNQKVLFASDYLRIAPDAAYNIILNISIVSESKVLDKYYLLLGRYYNSNGKIGQAKKQFHLGLSVTNDFFTEIDLLTEIGHYTQALSNTNEYLKEAENYTTRLKIAEKQYIIFNKIIQDNLDAGDLEKAFMNTERSKSIALHASLEISDEIKTIEQVQKTLRESELLLSYKILHDSLLLVFEITPTEFKLHRKNIGKDFYYNLDEFLLTHSTFHEIVVNKFNRFSKSAYNTYHLLLDDINISGKDVVIVPEERFYNLSYEALITQMPDTLSGDVLYRELDYLLYYNTFRYMYRASLNNKQTEYRPFSLLHIIPEKLTTRLRGSWKLHDLIKRKSTLLNDVELIEKYNNIKDDYSIVHFDTHAKLNMDRSLFSYMEFGGENLYVKDIIDSKVSNDIVVLSACNTGVGKVSKGEGGISFERAFILAGAKTIVTSFWPGIDDSSPRIFPIFYNELKKGKRPEVAIREAKLDYIKTQKMLDTQPFLWANYCIVGQSSIYSDFPMKRTRRLVLVGICLSLLILTFVLRKRLAPFFHK